MISRFLRRVVAILSVTLALSACKESTLLENLSQSQANQVLAVLQQHDIQAYKKGSLKLGYTISVATTDSTASLSILTQYQLPSKEDVQIAQAFPESSLVSSPKAEQVKVLSLEEQRMEQSLRIIPHVVNARIHISYPNDAEQSDTNNDKQRVGVLVTYIGDLNENLFISQIKEFIKNSLHAVRYDNISVVLFEAPPLQNTPPTPARATKFNIWLCLSAGVMAIAAACSIFVFTKKLLRKKLSEKSDAMGITTVDKQVAK